MAHLAIFLPFAPHLPNMAVGAPAPDDQTACCRHRDSSSRALDQRGLGLARRRRPGGVVLRILRGSGARIDRPARRRSLDHARSAVQRGCGTRSLTGAGEGQCPERAGCCKSSCCRGRPCHAWVSRRITVDPAARGLTLLPSDATPGERPQQGGEPPGSPNVTAPRRPTERAGPSGTPPSAPPRR